MNPAKADRKEISKVESAPPGLSPRRKPKGVLPPSPAPSPPGKGRPRLFHARGCAPCIPGAEPERHGLTCKQPIPFPLALNRRLPPPGCRGRSPRRKPKGVLPPSPCPFPPWGKGRPRLFHARGCAPCIPGAEPERHGLTCKQPIPPLLRRTVGSRRRGAGGGAPGEIKLKFSPFPPGRGLGGWGQDNKLKARLTGDRNRRPPLPPQKTSSRMEKANG